MTPAERKEPKPRKCKNKLCRAKFVPDRPFVEWCSPECGAELAKQKISHQQELRAKKARKEHKEAKEKSKTRGQWEAEAQASFNAFIRARDTGKPCISCGRHHQGAWDAGHYMARSVSPALRYDERNCHAQCVPCNRHKHGNLIEYRMGLIERVGAEVVDLLEGPHEPKKYSIEELKEIKATYRKKANELLKGESKC